MSKFSEKLKDFLYDATDYLIMIGVVAVVAGIIGWRLDILFASDTLDDQPEKNSIVTSNKKNTTNNSEKKDDKIIKDKKNENSKLDKESKKTENEEQKDEIVTISIPEGVSSEKIAGILLENDLIKDKKEFLDTAANLNLETKLRPGKFEIKQNSTYEEILQIITK